MHLKQHEEMQHGVNEAYEISLLQSLQVNEGGI